MRICLWEVLRGGVVIGYTWATNDQISEAQEYGQSIGDPLAYVHWGK